jgi:hypothetical protein
LVKAQELAVHLLLFFKFQQAAVVAVGQITGELHYLEAVVVVGRATLIILMAALEMFLH